MKILVTGGAGFIGSHVVDLYLQHGMEVVVIDDLSTGRLSNLNPAAKFYQLDIRSPELARVFEQERPQAVNHHAAQMDVRRSVVEPIFDADVNIGGSLNLLECSRRFGVERFIYISTGGAVYGEPQYLPCDENHPINPICQYGASKHTVEHYLYMYRQNYGLDYVVLRYPNVYGPRQDPHGEAGVVAIFAGQMLAGEEVTIYGDGEQERDFVYVADCARANLLALEQANGSGSGIYNLGSGRGTTVNQIFRALMSITNYGRPARYGPAKLGETRRIFLSAERARSDLGWAPSVDLQEGLHETVSAIKSDKSPQAVFVGRRSSEQAIATRTRANRQKTMGRQTRLDPRLDAAMAWDAVARTPGDHREFLARLLHTAANSVRASSGSAFLVDGRGALREAAVVQDGRLWDSEDSASCLQDSYAQGLAGWTITERKAGFVSDTARDDRWVRREWETTSRSALCVPLLAGRTVIGALTVCAPGRDAFSQAELALLMTMAGMLSLNGKEFKEELAPPTGIVQPSLHEIQEEALQ